MLNNLQFWSCTVYSVSEIGSVTEIPIHGRTNLGHPVFMCWSIDSNLINKQLISCFFFKFMQAVIKWFIALDVHCILSVSQQRAELKLAGFAVNPVVEWQMW